MDWAMLGDDAQNVTLSIDEAELFGGNSSCALQPDVTAGPYFVDGELIRSDIREDQAGVPLFLDIQIIDTSTCEPLPAVFLDIWHANPTGVYSGVAEDGNGNSDDLTNLDSTFLRGILPTDADGVVEFESIFPGHYTGRATHIHILSHNTNETTVGVNDTLITSNFTTASSHVGQLFFDQDLISAVEATSPYTTNTQDLLSNDEDEILTEETANSDPFFEYVYLNPDDITDGILAWIRLGIDPTEDEDVTSTGTYYKSGGVVNSDFHYTSGFGGPLSSATPSSASSS